MKYDSGGRKRAGMLKMAEFKDQTKGVAAFTPC